MRRGCGRWRGSRLSVVLHDRRQDRKRRRCRTLPRSAGQRRKGIRRPVADLDRSICDHAARPRNLADIVALAVEAKATITSSRSICLMQPILP
jgi:hypothetical protein